MVKNLPANARDAGDMSLTAGSGRSLEKEIATHSGILGLEKKNHGQRSLASYSP